MNHRHEKSLRALPPEKSEVEILPPEPTLSYLSPVPQLESGSAMIGTRHSGFKTHALSHSARLPWRDVPSPIVGEDLYFSCVLLSDVTTGKEERIVNWLEIGVRKE